MMTDTPHTISYTRRVLIAAAIPLLIATLLFLAWQWLGTLLLIFSGVLFGLFLIAAADWAHSHAHVSRRVALTVVILVLAVLLALLVAVGGPSIASQIGDVQERLPRALAQLRQDIGRYPLGQQLLAALPSADKLLSATPTVLSRVTGIVSGVLGALTNLLVIVLIGIFVAVNPRVYVEGTVRLVNPTRRDRIRQVMSDISTALKLWLVSRVAVMAFVGIITWIVLRVLGVPAAFLLALIAALLSFIPTFGPIIAAVPAILLALVQGPVTALWVALAFIVMHVTEGYVFDPILTEKIVDIPPALMLSTQILLGVLAGPMGLAVATPLTAALMVVIQRLYVEDVLHDAPRPTAGSA